MLANRMCGNLLARRTELQANGPASPCRTIHSEAFRPAASAPPAPTATPAIETVGLRKQYGGKVVLHDLSLSVRPGEVFGFLGPNGAGKTTTVKILLGLVQPSAGQARLFGAPVGQRDVRRRVGYLPENFRFHDWLSGSFP